MTAPDDASPHAAPDVCHRPVCDDRCSYPRCMGPATDDAALPAHTPSGDSLMLDWMEAHEGNWITHGGINSLAYDQPREWVHGASSLREAIRTAMAAQIGEPI